MDAQTKAQLIDIFRDASTGTLERERVRVAFAEAFQRTEFSLRNSEGVYCRNWLANPISRKLFVDNGDSFNDPETLSKYLKIACPETGLTHSKMARFVADGYNVTQPAGVLVAARTLRHWINVLEHS